MLRVLHCIYDDPGNPWVGGGGAERVRAIYTRLRSAVDVTVLTGHYPGARDETVDGVRYCRLGARRPYAWSRVTFGLAASHALRVRGYDAAVVDTSAYTPIVLPAGRPAAIAVQMLVGPHAARRWGALGGRVVARAERRWVRGARHVSAASHGLARALAPLLPGDARVAVVGNGVDTAFFAAPPTTPVVRPPGGAPVELLCYGRFDVHQKGHDVLLAALPAIRAAYPHVRLRCAGRGRELARLRALVAARGLEDQVVIEAGVTRERARALFAAAALLVVPSRFEGVPLTILEAIVAGLPVVATDVGGVREVCVDAGADALRLVPAGDAGALAAAVCAALGDLATGARARPPAPRVAAAWEWDTIAAQHLAFLHEVAAARGGAGGGSAGTAATVGMARTRTGLGIA